MNLICQLLVRFEQFIVFLSWAVSISFAIVSIAVFCNQLRFLWTIKLFGLLFDLNYWLFDFHFEMMNAVCELCQLHLNYWMFDFHFEIVKVVQLLVRFEQLFLQSNCGTNICCDVFIAFFCDVFGCIFWQLRFCWQSFVWCFLWNKILLHLLYKCDLFIIMFVFFSTLWCCESLFFLHFIKMSTSVFRLKTTSMFSTQ